MKAIGSKDARMAVVLGGLAAVAGYVMIWRPQSGSLGEAQEKRRDAEEELVRIQDSATTTTVVVTDGSGDIVLVAVPSRPELSTLLRQLEAIARETGTTVTSMTPAPLSTNPAGPGGSVQISIGASGSRVATDAYLGRLRDLERLLVIEQVGLQERSATAPVPAEDAPEIPEVTLQLTIRVFTADAPAVEGATS